MRNSHHTRYVLLLFVLGLLLFGVRALYAGELTYLALQREGQASVAVDEKKKVAYIIDLGRGGDGDQIKLGNISLLDRLELLGIEDLYFVCSHPHSDHMGGIKALFKDPRSFFRDGDPSAPRFKSVAVVDDGVPNTLYTYLRKTLAGNASIKTSHRSAARGNAFAGISTSADDVQIETIPYATTEKTGPHGRAVVTRIQLGQNEVLDFDDADSATIKKVVNALKARGVNQIRSFVVPHHGSKYHDIAPIFDLNPTRAIIAVNPENRYGHPSPSILLELMERLGKENVIFTGSVQNVVLDDNGVKFAMFTAADSDSYALFVAQNRIRAEKQGNAEDIKACAAIKAMMDDNGGSGPSPRSGAPPDGPPAAGPGRAGGSAHTLLEEGAKLSGSILQPEFDLGAVSYGRDGVDVLRGGKIFAYPLASSEDLTGRDVAVVVERPVIAEGVLPDKLSAAEARGVLQTLTLLGGNAEKANSVYIYFSSPTGLRDVLEPVLVTQPQELAAWAATRVPVLEPVRTVEPRPSRGGRPGSRGRPGSGRRSGSGGAPGTGASGTRIRPPGGITAQPGLPRPVASWRENVPMGGMVFLRGGRLFPAGEANELLGGSLDVCGQNYCVKTSGGDTYTLPFSPGQLFSEVWTRVYDRGIDSFYLSINPTKQFLKSMDAGFDRIPSDRLRYGSGQPGGGIRTHEVVTAGQIQGTQIGQILWEADVAFKSKSLGFNVLTGEADASFAEGAGDIAQMDSSPGDGRIRYRDRWCRLYWTSGSQRIRVNEGSKKIFFEGPAVLAQSEPMVMRGGDLVDYKTGTWCGESKSVAAALQEDANSGRGVLPVLWQLRDLAEIQTFVRWAHENGITPTAEFSQSISQHNSAVGSEVPTWTSGIKLQTAPLVTVQQQFGRGGSGYTNILHISLADASIYSRCVLPYWEAQNADFPNNGIKLRDGVWDVPPNKYEFVDGWMTSLANNVAVCSHARLLRPVARGGAAGANGPGVLPNTIGITPHVQSIQTSMHGGVLLGMQRGFLESAWKENGLLLSLSHRPLFQNANGKLHFWNHSDNDPRSGMLGQHVVIDDSKVTKASVEGGHLRFTVEAGPGAVALQESRWGHAANYRAGLEWAGARHASDGAWIWEKAVWPCAESRGTGCVQVEQSTLDELVAKTGGAKRDDPTINLEQVGANTWLVDLNISSFRSELDRRWKAIPSSNVDARLALIYEYAKWGFLTEALERYSEVESKLEGDTVDTILQKLLKMYSESK